MKPHLVTPFRHSNDPRFAGKVEDVAGPYPDPPDRAILPSVDGKSRIRALNRTRPGLSVKKGRAGTMTRGCRRHGATALFAAPNVLDGKVVGPCLRKRRRWELIRFPDRIDREVTPNPGVHPIACDHATRRHIRVRVWLARRPHFPMHFTPTSPSRLDPVKRFCAEITRRRIRHGVFPSVVDLQMTINDYLDQHNVEPVSFVWTASARSITERVNRGKPALKS